MTKIAGGARYLQPNSLPQTAPEQRQRESSLCYVDYLQCTTQLNILRSQPLCQQTMQAFPWHNCLASPTIAKTVTVLDSTCCYRLQASDASSLLASSHHVLLCTASQLWAGATQKCTRCGRLRCTGSSYGQAVSPAWPIQLCSVGQHTNINKRPEMTEGTRAL